mmetsp:Transcript_9576/g.21174  ORF Transcript_9576/g.21174 Transcript_9576/m.21174 type:complete len:212 (-) Transcript_9576:577-1212(-)
MLDHVQTDELGRPTGPDWSDPVHHMHHYHGQRRCPGKDGHHPLELNQQQRTVSAIEPAQVLRDRYTAGDPAEWAVGGEEAQQQRAGDPSGTVYRESPNHVVDLKLPLKKSSEQIGQTGTDPNHDGAKVRHGRTPRRDPHQPCQHSVAHGVGLQHSVSRLPVVHYGIIDTPHEPREARGQGGGHGHPSHSVCRGAGHSQRAAAVKTVPPDPQ